MASKKQLKRLESKYITLAFNEFLDSGHLVNRDLINGSFFEGLSDHIFKPKRKLNKANKKFIDRHVANENRKLPF